MTPASSSTASWLPPTQGDAVGSPASASGTVTGLVAAAAHAGGVFWRRPRRWDLRATAIAAWIAGASLAVALVHAMASSIPLVPWLIRVFQNRILSGKPSRSRAPGSSSWKKSASAASNERRPFGTILTV